MLNLIAEEKGDLSDAYKYYKLYISYNDSLINESNTKEQTQYEMQFRFDQQKAEDLLRQEKRDLIETQDRQKQIYLLWGLIIFIVLILFFAWFLNSRRKIEKAQKHLIENQKLLVEEKNKEILDSITYAKRIQTAILPTKKLVKEYFEKSFIFYKPKDIVAGDFYWVEPLKDEIIFAVADCTGHGVPGALVSVVCHNAMNRSVREFGLQNPGEILNKTRELIVNEFQKSDENVNDGMDLSLCCLNLSTRVLKWSGANLPLWIVKNNDRQLLEFKPSKQPIGQYANYIPFETTTVQLEKDDTIYLFSDGYADQFGGEFGKKMKSRRMKELILSIQEESLENQSLHLELFFKNWQGNLDQLDDVCIIGIQV